MTKDNRIFRPEQLNEEETKALASAASNFCDEYFARQEESEKRRSEEIERKLTSGELIEKDGKIYDARYFKD